MIVDIGSTIHLFVPFLSLSLYIHISEVEGIECAITHNWEIVSFCSCVRRAIFVSYVVSEQKSVEPHLELWSFAPVACYLFSFAPREFFNRVPEERCPCFLRDLLKSVLKDSSQREISSKEFLNRALHGSSLREFLTRVSGGSSSREFLKQ